MLSQGEKKISRPSERQEGRGGEHPHRSRG